MLSIICLFQMTNQEGFNTASDTLLSELNKRFARILKPKIRNSSGRLIDNPEFEPVYSVATALDPRFWLALNEDQLNAAKSEIRRLVSTLIRF